MIIDIDVCIVQCIISISNIMPTDNKWKKYFYAINCYHCVFQGFMDHRDDILSYLNKKGVSVIFLFRRNTLRRLISVLANNYDRDAKQLNGTHKSHVHSEEEVPLMHRQFQYIYYNDFALFPHVFA